MAVLRNIHIQPMGRRVTDVLAAAIDTPQTGDSLDQSTMTVSGWVIGKDGPMERVEAFADGRRLASAEVDRPTPELAERFGSAGAWTANAGFALTVETLGLDPAVEIRLRAMVGEKPIARIAAITANREPIAPRVTPRVDRLMVTTIGRTGSTLLMRLLAAHPEIVAYERERHEVRAAKYWLHVLLAMSEPAATDKSLGSENEFHLEPFVAGIPFLNAAYQPYPDLIAWAATSYRSLLADFAIAATDGWYERVAAAQGQQQPRFWAEKTFPDQYANLAREVWPNGKEIVLVRDFRDMWASMRSYNATKGRADFGRANAESEEAWLASMGHGAVQLANVAAKQAKRCHVVRYEDLVNAPIPTLTALLAYLDLDARDEVIAYMLEAALAERDDLADHITAGSVEASIGRWQRDLTPDDLAVAQRVLEQPLAAFGYPVS